MRKILIAVAVASLLLVSARTEVYAFAKDGQDCAKCHTLTAEQASDLLKNLIPDVKILEVSQAPASGLWEVAVETGRGKNVLYISYSKDRVIAGHVYDMKTKADLTQNTIQKISKVDPSLIPFANSVVMGDKDAKYKVFVFDDPE